ncbi:MAG: hypothetical protein J6M62_01775 [Selenomonadaceae bacterium]|nr:hypothetical protein [Selenomonadaceae bacterium]
MEDYNDYIKATKGYLRNYKQLQTAIKNLEREAELKRQELNNISVAISRYDGGINGGAKEFTATEAAAMKRGRLDEEIEEISGEISRIKNTLEKLDCAIESLNKTQKRLVAGYYFERRTWIELSIELYITEKWARIKGREAVEDVAFMLFGNKALPPGKKFIFL